MLAPTPYFSDRGCHVRIYEEAKALTALGHRVCIVTYHLGRDMPGVEVIRIPGIPWYNKLEAGPSWHKPYLDVLLMLKAYNIARTFRPDIIHAHLHEGALVGYLLKLVLRLPLLFDYQGSLSGESLNHGFFRDGSLLHRIFRGLERAINNFADGIVTSSGEGRSELIREFGMSPGKVTTLIDGVDTDYFRPCDKPSARSRLGVPLDSKVVVFLGLFNQYQGVDLLLEAIPLVKKRIPDVHFLLMGYPDAEYRRMASGLGISDLITFTGRVPYDSASFYLGAGDVAVSPKLARTEANGKLFNYMACGLPTVAFDSVINREILGDCAAYADYGSAGSLADSVITLLEDEARASLLGMRSRQRSEEVHCWSTRIAQLVDLYRRMILQSSTKKIAKKY